MTTTTTITALDDLLDQARRSIDEFTPNQVEAHIFDPSVLLVDLREADERAHEGFIAGSVHVPRGLLEFAAAPDSPLHVDGFELERPVILYCSRGARSALGGQALRGLGYQRVGHLADGFMAWRNGGHAVAGLAPWHHDH